MRLQSPRALAPIVLASALVPGVAFAGGFELIEQSPQGVSQVGARSALAEVDSVFYNPAGMAYQAGLNAQVGGLIGVLGTEVNSPDGTQVQADHTSIAPTFYLTQRLGRHFAVGVAGFSNFAEHYGYPDGWAGRFLGTFIDLTTYTFNPSVAFRPIPRLSFGAGVDLMPGSLDIYRHVAFAAEEGVVHVAFNAFGAGGNAGLLLDVVPQYLRFGFSYRSQINMHFTGHGAITAPPELQAQVGGLMLADTRITLPDNFTWALSTRPIPQLTIETDVRYTLWSENQALTVNLTPSGAASPAQTDTVALNLRDTWGVRIGGEYRALEDRLGVRLGVGYDPTPVPRSTLTPLIPDTNRVLISAGLGYQFRYFSLDAGYLAAVLLRTGATNPDLTANYGTVAHVVSAALTVRFRSVGGHLAANELAWSEETPGKRYARAEPSR